MKNKEKAKHAPTPWEITVNEVGELDITPEGGDMIADLKGCNNAEANAQFIVKAVNSHEALINALKLCLEALDEREMKLPFTRSVINNALRSAGAV